MARAFVCQMTFVHRLVVEVCELSSWLLRFVSCSLGCRGLWAVVLLVEACELSSWFFEACEMSSRYVSCQLGCWGLWAVAWLFEVCELSSWVLRFVRCRLGCWGIELCWLLSFVSWVGCYGSWAVVLVVEVCELSSLLIEVCEPIHHSISCFIIEKHCVVCCKSTGQSCFVSFLILWYELDICSSSVWPPRASNLVPCQDSQCVWGWTPGKSY